MKEPLPATFRINASSKGEGQRLLKIVKDELFAGYMNGLKEIDESNAEELEIKKPKCLTFYPQELAWQLDLTRKDIRRNEKVFRLHNFLQTETVSGNISRQEAVSMLPPLVLDVKSHHKCIDLCASPGSKTAQIIEALHSDETVKIPTGFVIANDIDNKRCYMLVHQAKRLNSPNIIVSNADASRYPNLFDKDGKIIKYDRILADVPCTGDGTLRKNIEIWKKWTQANAIGLHGVQFRIARRAAEMLTVGGRMVYSTCSLNPLENEAVICHLLKEAEGALELVEVGSQFNGLVYSKGVTSWSPATKDLQFFEKFDDVPLEIRPVLYRDLFPPKDIEKFNLQHCIRVLPHYQNTGGFFIAVIEKRKMLPWEEKIDQQAIETVARIAKEKEEGLTAAKRPKFIQGFKEEPFNLFKPDDSLFMIFKNFFDLSEDFQPTCLFTRCAEESKRKNVYFCSPETCDILRYNENSVKVINAGVKAFVRCDRRIVDCHYRLSSEGLNTIQHFVGAKRRIQIGKDDLVMLLNHLNPADALFATELSEEMQKHHRNITSGSCVLEYKDEENEFELFLVGWRGTTSVRAYIDVNDSIHILRLLNSDLSKYGKALHT